MSNKILPFFIYLLIALVILPKQIFAKVFINEVMPLPSSPKIKWVELYNENEKEYSLKNYILSTEGSKSCALNTNNETRFELSGLIKKYFVIETPLLDLENTKLTLVNCKSKEDNIEDTFIVGKVAKDISVYRKTDGGLDIEQSKDNTKNSTNNLTDNKKPVISQFKFLKDSFTPKENITFRFKLLEKKLDSIEIYINDTLQKVVTKNINNFVFNIKTDQTYVGENRLKIIIKDQNNNTQTINKSFNINSLGPLVFISDVENRYVNESVNIKGTASGDNKISKITAFYKKLEDTDFKEYKDIEIKDSTYKNNFEFNFKPKIEGEVNLLIKIKDTEGRIYEYPYKEILIFNNQFPKIYISTQPKIASGANNYFTSNTSFKIIKLQENIEEDIYYKINTKEWLKYNGKVTLQEGKNNVLFKTKYKDVESKIIKETFLVDNIAPKVFSKISEQNFNRNSLIRNSTLNIELFSPDEDTDKILYSTDNKNFNNYLNPISIKKSDNLHFKAVDKAGNESEIKKFNLVELDNEQEPTSIRSIKTDVTSKNTIKITWKDKEPQDTYYYEIYRSNTKNIEPTKKYFLTAVPSTELFYEDKFAKNNSKYFYLIVKKTVSGKKTEPIKIIANTNNNAYENVLGSFTTNPDETDSTLELHPIQIANVEFEESFSTNDQKNWAIILLVLTIFTYIINKALKNYRRTI